MASSERRIERLSLRIRRGTVSDHARFAADVARALGAAMADAPLTRSRERVEVRVSARAARSAGEKLVGVVVSAVLEAIR